MYQFSIIYSIIAIWTFGWLTGTFGASTSWRASVLLAFPAILSWRIVAARRPIHLGHSIYITCATLFTIVCSMWLTSQWSVMGEDRLAWLDREVHAVRRALNSQLRFKNVGISYFRTKAGMCVHLDGSVPSKITHDDLIQLIKRRIRNNEGGYSDGVDYPGKDYPGK